MNTTPTFAYVLRLVRREAFCKMTAREEPVVDEHFKYLKKGLAEKKVILAGPCLDGEFGIVTSSHGLKLVGFPFRLPCLRPSPGRCVGKPAVEVATPGLSCAAPFQPAHLARRGGLRCASRCSETTIRLGKQRLQLFGCGGAAPAVSPQGPKICARQKVFKPSIWAPQLLPPLKGVGFPATEL